MKIYEKKTADIINPFYAKCGNYLCKAINNLIDYTFLNFNKTIPAIVILDIFYDFIIVKKMKSKSKPAIFKKYKYN